LAVIASMRFSHERMDETHHREAVVHGRAKSKVVSQAPQRRSGDARARRCEHCTRFHAGNSLPLIRSRHEGLSVRMLLPACGPSRVAIALLITLLAQGLRQLLGNTSRPSLAERATQIFTNDQAQWLPVAATALATRCCVPFRRAEHHPNPSRTISSARTRMRETSSP
jgi:hypothetical protein